MTWTEPTRERHRSPSPMRILIVDDHEMTRRSIRSLLETISYCEVCGEATDGFDAVEKAKLLRPECILMDVTMPRLNGLEATRLILRDAPKIRVLIVTQNEPGVARLQAEASGACGFLPKSELDTKLLSAIEAAFASLNAWQAGGSSSPADLPAARQDIARVPESPRPPSANDCLSGGGQMGALMRSMEWSHTVFGPVEAWPQSLRTALSIMLDSVFGMVVAWGPEFRFFYNDRYRPVLGTSKHPGALGTPAQEIFPEAWPFIGPLFARTRLGESIALDDQLIPLNRYGYLENCYFTLSYSPIRDESGGVGGMLAVVAETTERVEGERRLKTLRDLMRRASDARTAEEACADAAITLGENPIDVPFALFYLLDSSGKRARLVALTGLERGTAASPEFVDLTVETEDGWPLAGAVRKQQSLVLADLPGRFGPLPGGEYLEKAHTAVLVPLARPGQIHPDGVVVFGVSPRRALDSKYRDFYELAADHILTALRNALAYEEERQKAQQLAELDRAKTAFFSNVSHEFRTPLTLIIGPVEEILSKPDHGLTPTEREQVATVYRNSKRLLKLVNTLLDFSRIEAGRVEAVYGPTDLPSFTAELASVFRSATEKAGLELSIDCGPLEEPVYVDASMWEKIVLNLLSNAFKFTFEGKIAVSLIKAGERVELSVSDTGIGIPESELPRLFERFHRIEGSRGRTFEGSGIGLALVQELVKLHGGSIRVRSAEGVGTTFTISIPLGKEHLPENRIEAARSGISSSVSADSYVAEALLWLADTPREEADAATVGNSLDVALVSAASEGSRDHEIRPLVIVADDNSDMLGYLSRLLKRHYRVHGVSNGLEAILAVRELNPDLILTDIMMPGLDGLGILQEIRNDVATAGKPVIFLSARAGDEARIAGLQAGADDYIVKPFSARELLARVGSALSLAKVRRDAEEASRRRAAQFETLLNEAPVGVFFVDANLRIRQMNPTAVPFFGNIPNLIGRDLREVVQRIWTEAVASKIIGQFRHTLETGEAYIVPEYVEERRDRGVREYYEWQINRILLPDGDHGVVCYFRDISAQVRGRETIREREEALKLAHDKLEEQVLTRTQELEGRNAEVLKKAEQLTELSARLLNAQDEERRRIARELHDSAGQMLAVLSINLSQIARTTTQRNAGEPQLIEDSRQLVEQLTQEIRTLSYLLHPPLLDDTGLSGALRWYVDGLTQRSGIRIELELSENLSRLPRELETGIFRIVQECLTNIHRHSGSPSATIRVQQDSEWILVEVQDRGKGIAPEKLSRIKSAGSGVGIRGMSERIRHFGGVLDIESNGQGTKVAVKFPLIKNASVHAD